MKILLVKPPQKNKILFHIMPPLGLGYLAYSVRRLNLDIKTEMLDCALKRTSYSDLIYRIKTLRPDIVGFTVYSHDIDNVKTISSLIKDKISDEITIIAGGPHPSVAPRETLEYLPAVDFVFKGESETGFPILVEYLYRKNMSAANLDMGDKMLDEIPGLARRLNRSHIKVNEQIFIENVDSLGFPDWEAIDPVRYFKTCQGVFSKGDRFIPIFTTRGCPHMCDFCSAHNIMGRRIRRRSIRHIIEEIIYLKNNFDIDEFHILDDNFTEDRNFVISFCKEIIHKGICVFWTCPNGIRLDTLDGEMLDFMKRAGCYSVFLGIESGSQRILDKMKKGLTLGQIRETVNLIKSKGFIITGFFIMGYPEETIGDMRATIDFAKSLPLDIADLNNFLPLPGTGIFEKLRRDGGIDRLAPVDFASPYHAPGTYKHRSSRKTQLCMVRKGYLEFYLRPHVLIKLISKIKNKYQLYFMLKRLIAIFVS